VWVLRFRHEGKGVAVPVLQSPLAVGRAEGNDVVLRAPGVSRRHCEFILEEDGRGLRVRDLNSKLGTRKGAQALEEAALAEGDCLSVGPVWVFVQRELTADWEDSAGRRPEFPFVLGGEAAPGDTRVPEVEMIPAPLFHACLEGFLAGSDWGRRWISILGIEDLELVYEEGTEHLCLWPGRWNPPPEAALCLSLQGRSGIWRLRVAGCPEERRALLKALLQVLDVVHTQPAHRKPPILAPARVPRRFISLRRVWDQVERFVGTDLPILITGETGSGKEVLARAVHEAGPGLHAPFEVIHCAAIPETLFESELFGIEPNTASGVTGRKGKLELSDGGTIFLDEVGEIPLSVQAKLLRVLQDASVMPVGGRKSKPLRIRWISATNRELGEEIREGRFRSDLFYRLAGVEVTVPPLRERTEELPELVEHFVGALEMEHGRGVRGLSVEAYRTLMAYPWPGNVRELQTEVKRAYFLAEPGGLIQRGHLSQRVRDGATEPPPSLDHRRKEVEVRRIEEALKAAGGNVTRAAAKLGITRQTLAKRVKEMGIEKPVD
jgi:DNA-binding NtrC family response regulator